nr:substrate-binding domain-containing protein [Arthrobacter sp. ok909]
MCTLCTFWASVWVVCGLTALWNAGIRVPDELSVAGFDNIFTTSLAPISITTVDQSGLDMGAAAGRLLLERIGGRSEAVNTVVRPTLVARKTPAAPQLTVST